MRSYTAHQSFKWTTWNLCFRIYLFFYTKKLLKNHNNFFHFCHRGWNSLPGACSDLDLAIHKQTNVCWSMPRSQTVFIHFKICIRYAENGNYEAFVVVHCGHFQFWPGITFCTKATQICKTAILHPNIIMTQWNNHFLKCSFTVVFCINYGFTKTV